MTSFESIQLLPTLRQFAPCLASPRSVLRIPAKTLYEIEGTRFVLGTPILVEYIDGVTKRVGKPKAIEELESILSSRLLLVEEDIEKDFERGIYYFKKYRDRIDLTDCISFAMIERLELDGVFTFDRDFKIHGFKVIP